MNIMFKLLYGAYKDFQKSRKADLKLLRQGMEDRRTRGDSVEARRTIHEIVEAYGRAQEMAEAALPPAYQTGGAWLADIRQRRGDYLTALAAGDIDTLTQLFTNFFRNSGVAGITTYAYYQDLQGGGKRAKKEYIKAVLDDYAVWKDLEEGVSLKEVAAPAVGNPWGCLIEGSLVLSNSFRHHYYAHRVRNLLGDAGRPVVAEIGGGYGGFAYYLLAQPKEYVYIGFDLPIILAIQTYYLKNSFPEKRFLLYRNSEEMITAEVLANYDIILMPHYQLPRLADQTVDLFINTNSLSEMDYATVEEYLRQIARTCKRYLFLENSDRSVVNTGGHREVPASAFPIAPDFKRLYKHYSPWEGGQGRQREYLYERQP